MDESLTLALGAGVGIVSVPLIVNRAVMALKDLFPGLHGAAAVRVVYAMSAVLSTVMLTALGSYTGVTADVATVAALALAWFTFTLGMAEYAKGVYSNDNKVAVAGSPPGPNAEVPQSAVRDADAPRPAIAPIRSTTYGQERTGT